MAIYTGTSGNDYYNYTGSEFLIGYGLAGNDTILGNTSNDTLYGQDGNDSLNGWTANDYLSGGNGDDIMIGGLGNDTMLGGYGNDSYYVDSVLDVTTESAAAGSDTVYSTVSRSLGANLENLVLTGTALNGYGNDADNQLTGNSSNNYLSGGGGNDTVNGASGNDTLLAGSGLINKLYGGTGNDSLVGGSEYDWLDGGTGNDTMVGGAKDDTYYVDSVSDVIVEAANAGYDDVYSSVTYVLSSSSNVEDLFLTGFNAINGYGSDFSNNLTGNEANNILSGGLGNDTVTGKGGNDSLYGGNGVDKLYGDAGDDYLSGFIDNDQLTGGIGNDVINGGAGDDLIEGNAGNDTLTGSTNSDTFKYYTGVPFSAASLGTDTITDFTVGSDRIILDKTTFTALSSNVGVGFSVSSEFGIVNSDAAAATSGADIVYNSANGNLFYNQNGAAAGLGTGALFATLSGAPALNASSFLIDDYTPPA